MLGLYLRDTINNEPFLFSHVVKYSINMSMIQPVWEGIADGKWNENQLKEFQEVFEGDNWLAKFKQTMIGERTLSIHTIDYIQNSRRNYLNFLSDRTFDDDLFFDYIWPSTSIKYFLFPRGWFYQNKLNFCKRVDPFLSDIVNAEKMTLDIEQITILDTANRYLKNSPQNFIAGMLVPSLSSAVLATGRAQAASHRAAIACAIERYRLTTGSLPKTLDQLVPSYMETLPHDVINDEPLIYKPEGNHRYLLYSVGSDQTDDGGDFKKDWVWLYEAAPSSNAANANN